MTALDEEQLDAGLRAKAPRDLTADVAALADLEAQLPELRQVPGSPAGTDAAILAISRPRGYAACANPYGSDLIGSADLERIERAPYATDITTGKGHLTYKAHSYPTKVPHEAIMRFLLHYTEPGDLMLDGFCGSGMAGVAAQACGKPDDDIRERIEAEMPYVRWGARKAFLQDLAPNATFLAAGLNLPVDADEFDRASKDLLARFEREWGWMYETKTPKGDKAVDRLHDLVRGLLAAPTALARSSSTTPHSTRRRTAIGMHSCALSAAPLSPRTA